MITASAAATVLVGCHPSRSGLHSCVPATTDVMPSDAWASAHAATVAARWSAPASLPVSTPLAAPTGVRPVTVIVADFVPCATTVGAVICKSEASPDVNPDTAATKEVAIGRSADGAVDAAGDPPGDPPGDAAADPELDDGLPFASRPGCARRQVS